MHVSFWIYKYVHTAMFWLMKITFYSMNECQFSRLEKWPGVDPDRLLALDAGIILLISPSTPSPRGIVGWEGITYKISLIARHVEATPSNVTHS